MRASEGRPRIGRVSHVLKSFNLLTTMMPADEKYHTSSDIRYRVRAIFMLHGSHLHEDQSETRYTLWKESLIFHLDRLSVLPVFT